MSFFRKQNTLNEYEAQSRLKRPNQEPAAEFANKVPKFASKRAKFANKVPKLADKPRKLKVKATKSRANHRIG
ncbi:hypothetical protein CVN76_20495 [Bacillus sp. mrc49]|nr:hypothetical protein CVN76_20495 [Bacillus sp. mrc49]